MLDTMTLKQVVGFCILTENGQGIVYKSPDYIDEKMRSMWRCQSDEMIKALLDLANQVKYDLWIKYWEKYL